MEPASPAATDSSDASGSILELRSGRVRAAIHASFVWADDALVEPENEQSAARLARQLSKVPPVVRERFHARKLAMVESERRFLDVNTAEGGDPLQSVVFQAVAVRSLGGPLAVYAGRDLALPASPDEALDRYLSGVKRSIGAEVREAAVSIIADVEAEQARRRVRVVEALLQAVEAGSTRTRDASALWVSGGRAYLIESNQFPELHELRDAWRREEQERFGRLRELIGQ